MAQDIRAWRSVVTGKREVDWARKDEAKVTNDDNEADTVVITSIDTLDKLRTGDLNPMMAMMSGKVKIKGDMGLAMKLQSLLG